MKQSVPLTQFASRCIQSIVLLLCFAVPAQADVVENFDLPPDSLYFSFSDVGTTTFQQTTSADAGISAPTGQAADDPILQFNLPDSGFAGVGRNFFGSSGSGFAGSQDWSAASGMQFWLHGTGNGNTLRMSLLDTNSSFAGELWITDFLDDMAGWRLIELSFADFFNAPYSVVDDNVFNTDSIYSWALLGVDGVTGGTYYLEDIELTGVPLPATAWTFVVGLLVLLRRRCVAR